MKKILLVLGIWLFTFLLVAPAITVSSQKDEIFKEVEEISEAYPVAVVFGAGVRNGAPSDVLMDRLRATSDLYYAGLVENILVSGDNSVEDYNEPEVMQGYLIEVFGIPEEKIFIDFAGRRTFDTCVRAKELWQVDKAILVTQEFHLPRAMMTCEALGIENIGFSATRQAYRNDDWFAFRERLAVYKAWVDIYIWKPSYIGGEVEGDL